MRSRIKLSLLLILIIAWSATEPCAAQILGMTGPSTAVYTADLYKFCSDRGGTPEYGRCYFGDGSYCDLWDFYKGICTSKTMVEQSLWEADISQFLYGDYGYGAMVPYSPAGATQRSPRGSGGTIIQPYPAFLGHSDDSGIAVTSVNPVMVRKQRLFLAETWGQCPLQSGPSMKGL